MEHGPLHQFVIYPLVDIHLWGWDISFTNAALFMVLSVVLPVLFLLAPRPYRAIPTRMQAYVEMTYAFVARMLEETNEEKGLPYLPLIFSLFMFLLCGNLLGMIPYGFTFTSHLIVTFGLAGLLFCIITLVGIIKHGRKFLALFIPPGVPLLLMPLMLPVEVLSYLSRPVSLGVRLFANMMAGHTMLKVFGGFTISLGLMGVAPLAINTLLVGFEVLVSCLQSYVFTILTCIYLHDALYLHGQSH
jgi:F-type H+-transporting ATPase subunit a